MKYESETIEKITELRISILSSKSVDDKVKANNELINSLNHLFATAENYPELKSSDEFLNLQNALAKIEDEMAASRRTYNSAVTDFNTAISVFPSVIVAKIGNFKSKELFNTLNRDNIDIKKTLDM
jgi:LemA protein